MSNFISSGYSKNNTYNFDFLSPISSANILDIYQTHVSLGGGFVGPLADMVTRLRRADFMRLQTASLQLLTMSKLSYDQLSWMYGSVKGLYSGRDRDAKFTEFIGPGQSLEVGRKYWAANFQYYLEFQVDGNLVVYDKSRKAVWAASWSADASMGSEMKAFQLFGRTVFGANKCVMQDDGNLVIYKGSTPVWATNTDGVIGASLALGEDGSLVIGKFRTVLQGLSPAQIGQLPLEVFPNLTIAQICDLTPKQLCGLKAEQVGELSQQQVRAINFKNFGALTVNETIKFIEVFFGSTKFAISRQQTFDWFFNMRSNIFLGLIAAASGRSKVGDIIEVSAKSLRDIRFSDGSAIDGNTIQAASKIFNILDDIDLNALLNIAPNITWQELSAAVDPIDFTKILIKYGVCTERMLLNIISKDSISLVKTWVDFIASNPNAEYENLNSYVNQHQNLFLQSASTINASNPFKRVLNPVSSLLFQKFAATLAGIFSAGAISTKGSNPDVVIDRLPEFKNPSVAGASNNDQPTVSEMEWRIFIEKNQPSELLEDFILERRADIPRNILELFKPETLKRYIELQTKWYQDNPNIYNGVLADGIKEIFACLNPNGKPVIFKNIETAFLNKSYLDKIGYFASVVENADNESFATTKNLYNVETAYRRYRSSIVTRLFLAESNRNGDVLLKFIKSKDLQKSPSIQSLDIVRIVENTIFGVNDALTIGSKLTGLNLEYYAAYATAKQFLTSHRLWLFNATTMGVCPSFEGCY